MFKGSKYRAFALLSKICGDLHLDRFGKRESQSSQICLRKRIEIAKRLLNWWLGR